MFQDIVIKYLFIYFLGFALVVAKRWPDLAWARDQNNDTALHILAFNQVPLHSCSHCPDIADPIRINPGKFLHSPISGFEFYIFSLVTDFLSFRNEKTCDFPIG